MMACGTARTLDAAATGTGSRRAMAVLAAWAALSVGSAMARAADAPLRIPLEPMGYQATLPELMLGGDSALTVDFVDRDHLLITFAVRRLMKREPDALPNDDDRTIAARLVELPSGKVLAGTEWRVHDRMQYLWSLGHGQFLLRVRDRLMEIAPMAAASNDAFREIPLLYTDRHIVAIVVSSDSDLLTVYTVKRTAGAGGSVEVSLEGPAVDPSPVQVNFYRLAQTSESANGLQATPAGAIRAHEAASLPLTTGGFLDVLDGGPGTWLFNFDEHAGKVHELLAFDTSCFPRSTFVDRAEFVVFGCRGSDERQDFAGFNLKGDEMWQINFTDTQVNPTFSFAPAAGRFALGRALVGSQIDLNSPTLAGLLTGQEVRVYQTYNGKQLFRMDLTPVERAGQNFALSADGMRLAVVRETQVRHAATKDFDAYIQRGAAVEIYALPPLTKDDQAAIKAVEALTPVDARVRIDEALRRVSAADAKANGGSVRLGESTVSALVGNAAQTTSAPDSASGAEASAATSADETGIDAGATLGDVQPEGPRKPPTLYAPGEKPEKQPQ